VPSADPVVDALELGLDGAGRRLRDLGHVRSSRLSGGRGYSVAPRASAGPPEEALAPVSQPTAERTTERTSSWLAGSSSAVSASPRLS
jgi:hypothetical protein